MTPISSPSPAATSRPRPFQTISSRISLVSALAVLFFVALVASVQIMASYNAALIGQVNTNFKQAADSSFALIIALKDLGADAHDASRAAAQGVASRRGETLDDLAAGLREKFAALSGIAERTQAPDIMRATAAIKSPLDALLAIVRAATPDAPAARDTLTVAADAFQQALFAATTQTETLLARNRTQTSEAIEKLILVIEIERALALVTALGGTIVAIGLAILLRKTISQRLVAMAETMTRLARGATEVAIPCIGRRDEIGQMADAVQVFRENAVERNRLQAEREQAERASAQARREELHRLADDFHDAVAGIVDSVSNAALEFETVAGALNTTALTTENLTHSLADSAQTASGNVQTAALATERLSASIGEIARQIEESSGIAGEAVVQTKAADVRIAALSEAGGRIGDVIRLIAEIAEQTNLLALNATIEAARAGEAGKGFSVVAQEVKKLASQTARATQEIGAQIGGIQTATAETNAAIKSIGGTIDRVASISQAITTVIQQQGAATAEIANNVQSAARGTAHVASDVGEVSRGASETGAASNQMLASAQALSERSRKLKNEIAEFLASIRAA
jgi:methyl-accepting chemotaxis protein